MSTIQIIVAGLIATSAMTLFLYIIHFSRLANADMVGAIGSIFTPDMKKARMFGGLIHYTTGCALAFLYVGVWSFIDINKLMPGIGLFTGFAQGLVVSLMLVVLIAEHHPNDSFRRAGFGVAIAHLLAHIVYGGFLEINARYLETSEQLITSIGRVLYG
ncbi:MAG: hypothetical protein HRU09_16190 [Oligoflexales bacterium]|nr:hypothetical protein [Oligoflexales bacterium]